MTLLIVVMVGFLIPLVFGTLVVARLRRRFRQRKPVLMWDALAVVSAAPLVLLYYLLVTLFGGDTVSGDATTVISYASRMTLLTAPFWGALGLILPRISVASDGLSRR